jgi:hypothetical protein
MRAGQVITTPFDIEVLRQDAIGVWDGNRWSGLDMTPAGDRDSTVLAVAVSGTHLYVALDSTSGDGVNRGRVIKWNGRTWSAMGESFNGSIWAVAVKGSDVYVGGDFTIAGQNAALRVAKWSGEKWTSVGGGVDGCKDLGCSPAVYALAINGGDVYAAGRFAHAGQAITANGIARWNGERWSSLQAGVASGVYDGVVWTLGLRGTSVYAGGQFRTAGAIAVNNVAEWNGDSWSALDSGVRGGLERVHALGVVGSDKLLVGGDFNMAGSVEVSRVAMWDGHQWSGVDIQAHDRVSAIAVSGSVAYLAGSLFTLPSGHKIRGVARWDGSWAGLGNGLVTARLPPFVRVLTAHGNEVFAAGEPFIFPNSGNERQ